MIPVPFMQWAARLCFALALLVMAGTAVAWVAQRPAFDIRRIDVRSASANGELRHVNRNALRTAIAGHLRGNFFTMRLTETQRVFESVPWVAGASVRRLWPGRLVITLTEHQALGLWSDGRLLSEEGRLFAASAGEAELDGALIEFDGPPEQAAEAARRYYEFADALAPLGLQVTAVKVSERASWSLRTGNRQRFELGRDEPEGSVTRRLERVTQHYPLIVARIGGDPVRIDARYPNGFAAAAPSEKSTKTR